MSNKTNKLIGKKGLGGDSWRKHLRKAGKRAANKASRKAAKVRA